MKVAALDALWESKTALSALLLHRIQYCGGLGWWRIHVGIVGVVVGDNESSHPHVTAPSCFD